MTVMNHRIAALAAIAAASAAALIRLIGGGVSSGFDLLRPGIEHQIRLRAMPAFRGVPVVASTLGQNSGIIGAACAALPQDGVP